LARLARLALLHQQAVATAVTQLLGLLLLQQAVAVVAAVFLVLMG
jgi:hypothetical protein